MRAVIAIEPFAPDLLGHPFLLPELYDWEPIEGYWVSASSRLRIRHKEFHWASTDTLLRSVP